MSRENSPRHGSIRRHLNNRDSPVGSPGSPHQLHQHQHQHQSNHPHHQQQQPSIMENAGAPISTSASNIATVLEDGENTILPPLSGSGPSRQRSLRDRLKDGITGSFSWQ
ncbi:GH22676 [Drosophila grimshawi]|uniref:GH22676 n=2 Tax=Drosophila grimshawi TaxID=7222 RepID=B4JSN7_DROGR|nr:GH22676 [Drosophila grimshawi]